MLIDIIAFKETKLEIDIVHGIMETKQMQTNLNDLCFLVKKIKNKGRISITKVYTD